ncbi:MAG: HEAT repeat domain-containing protein [Solirubrobacteraceae bacterium]
MALILVILIVAGAAVAVTVLLAVGQRTWGEITARRLAAYQGQVQEQLTGFVAGVRDDPPSRPRTRFQQRVMRQDLVAIAPNVKGEAARQLAEAFADYGLVELARRDLDSRDSLTRIRAAEALGAMRVEEAVPWLRERLHHPDASLQLACARALADLRAIDALPEITGALAASGAESGEVAEILLTFGPLAVPFLRVRAADSPAAERRLAVAALGEIRALDAAPDLRARLADPDPEVVAGAARALGQVGDTTAVGPVLEALQDPERPWFVHVAAAGALGELDDPVAAPALAAALGEDEWDVRNAAARSLAAMGEAGLDAVAAGLDDLPEAGVAHYSGTLDVDDRLRPVIERAAAGDERLERLVRRAAAANVTARLEELAATRTRERAFALELLGDGHGAAR